MTEVSFRALGRLEVEVDGRRLELAKRRERTLLAVLMLNANAFVSVDILISVIWDVPPRTARQQIYTAVATIRRVLEPAGAVAHIDSADGGYCLRVPKTLIDVHQFRETLSEAQAFLGEDRIVEARQMLEAATHFWRGPAFEGLGGAYIDGMAAGLEEQRLEAIELLVGCRIRSGERAELVSDLHRLVAENPLREAMYAQLMSVLLDCGRRAEALAVFENAKRALARDLEVEPGPALKNVWRQAMEGEIAPIDSATSGSARPVAESSRTEEGTVSARGRTCSLPHDIEEFTGRDAEVLQLRDFLEADARTAVRIMAIIGMGGVGKSALAVHAAHLAAAHYPGGQYFVDLRGFTAGSRPLSASQALEILLRDCGVPAERIPAEADRRAALWRAQLSQRRALVVIDNAVNEAQIKPLLPNTGMNAVIVTSRRRLPGIAGGALSVDCMRLDESTALFAAIAGEARIRGYEQAVVEIVERCGQLPLAIRIAAALFRDRVAWQPADLIRVLRRRRGRKRLLEAAGQSVRDVAALSYLHLTTAQRLVFRLLGGVPCDDFDAYAVSALAEISVDEAEIHLEALLDNNLLMQRAAERYRFHDVVRDYALELWTREESSAASVHALRRFVSYYLVLVGKLCRPFALSPFQMEVSPSGVAQELPETQGLKDHCDVLAIEYANIVSVVRYAAEREWHEESWRLACAFQPYLRLINYGSSAQVLFEQAHASALAVGEKKGAGLALFALARVAHIRENMPRAEKLLSRAMVLSRQGRDRCAEIYELILQGTLFYERMLFLEARAAYEQARLAAVADEDEAAQAAVGNNLGVVQRDLGEYALAFDAFLETSAFYASGESTEAAATWTNLGTEYLRRGMLDEAKAETERALALSRTLGYPYGEVHALLGLASLQLELNDLAAFGAACCGAMNKAREHGLFQAECEALILSGDFELATGQAETAREHYTNALNQATRYALARTRGQALDGLAHVALGEGDAEQAHLLWTRALTCHVEVLAESRSVRFHIEALKRGDGLPSRGGTCTRCARTRE